MDSVKGRCSWSSVLLDNLSSRNIQTLECTVHASELHHLSNRLLLKKNSSDFRIQNPTSSHSGHFHSCSADWKFCLLIVLVKCCFIIIRFLVQKSDFGPASLLCLSFISLYLSIHSLSSSFRSLSKFSPRYVLLIHSQPALCFSPYSQSISQLISMHRTFTLISSHVSVPPGLPIFFPKKILVSLPVNHSQM